MMHDDARRNLERRPVLLEGCCTVIISVGDVASSSGKRPDDISKL